MELQILQDGIYNDQFNRAHTRVAGEKHIASSIYGRSLIESGYAEPWTEPIVQLDEEKLQDYAWIEVPGVIAETDEIDKLVSPDVDLLLDAGVSETIVVRLQVRGLGTLAQVDMTSDEELLTVPGLGSVTLEKIRAFLKEEHFEVA